MLSAPGKREQGSATSQLARGWQALAGLPVGRWAVHADMLLRRASTLRRRAIRLLGEARAATPSRERLVRSLRPRWRGVTRDQEENRPRCSLTWTDGAVTLITAARGRPRSAARDPDRCLEDAGPRVASPGLDPKAASSAATGASHHHSQVRRPTSPDFMRQACWARSPRSSRPTSCRAASRGAARSRVAQPHAVRPDRASGRTTGPVLLLGQVVERRWTPAHRRPQLRREGTCAGCQPSRSMRATLSLSAGTPSSARMRCTSALISARCVNACG